MTGGKFTAAGREVLKRRALERQQEEQDAELAMIASTVQFSSGETDIPAVIQDLKFGTASVVDQAESLIQDISFSSTSGSFDTLIDDIAFLVQKRAVDSAVTTLQFGLNKTPLEQEEVLSELSFLSN